MPTSLTKLSKSAMCGKITVVQLSTIYQNPASMKSAIRATKIGVKNEGIIDDIGKLLNAKKNRVGRNTYCRRVFLKENLCS